MASTPPPPLPAVTLTEYRVWTLPSSLQFCSPIKLQCHLALGKISHCAPLSPYPNLRLTLLLSPNCLGEMGKELPWASKGRLHNACLELLLMSFKENYFLKMVKPLS